MSLETDFPVSLKEISVAGEHSVGLIIVDAGVAFTRSGALSDPTHMVPMVRKISAHYQNLKATLGSRLHTLCFLDTHHADIPEPPYPPHGIIGTGEENMDPELEYLLHEPQVTVIRKDCINGFVGGIDRDTGRNRVAEWVKNTGIKQILVTGDCTDICVSDFVVTMLSARNHGLLSAATTHDALVADITSLDIIVLADACDTYDAPWHARGPAHHVGLWFMGSRGATLAGSWIGQP